MKKSPAHAMISAVRSRAAARGVTATFVLHCEKSHLMRIGNNSVSLNTSEMLTRLDIEVINGRRTGTHTQMGDVTSEEYIEKALQIAVNKAEVASEKAYQPIHDQVEKAISEKHQYDQALEELDPAVKAAAYQRIIKEVGAHYNFSGSWSSGSVDLFMVSTANDLTVHHLATDQFFNVVLKHPEKKWELRLAATGWRQADFKVEEIITRFKKLLPIYEKNPATHIEPGEYTVAFGGDAIAEILEMAVYTGFFGRPYEEQQGWTCKNKKGDLVLGANVTITDDPANDKTYRQGFDLSGKHRQAWSVVENGKLQNLMYDSSTAAKYGRPLTGHNNCSLSIVMQHGKDTADLLEAVKGMGWFFIFQPCIISIFRMPVREFSPAVPALTLC